MKKIIAIIISTLLIFSTFIIFISASNTTTNTLTGEFTFQLDAFYSVYPIIHPDANLTKHDISLPDSIPTEEPFAVTFNFQLVEEPLDAKYGIIIGKLFYDATKVTPVLTGDGAVRAETNSDQTWDVSLCIAKTDPVKGAYVEINFAIIADFDDDNAFGQGYGIYYEDDFNVFFTLLQEEESSIEESSEEESSIEESSEEESSEEESSIEESSIEESSIEESSIEESSEEESSIEESSIEESSIEESSELPETGAPSKAYLTFGILTIITLAGFVTVKKLR